MPAHEGPVTGLSVDACNRYLVSAGWDGKLRAWDFTKRRLKGTLDCGSPVTRMCHHADSALVAVACDDLLIRMYDIEVRARAVDPKPCIGCGARARSCAAAGGP